MYPKHAVDIFMRMESRTRTVCTGRFHSYYFTLQDLCTRIKVYHCTRNMLLEPYFRCFIHISTMNRRIRKTGGREVFCLLCITFISKESVF